MRTPDHNPAQPAPRGQDGAAALLTLIRDLVAEIHRRPPSRQTVTLDDSLDRDLGLDSLARVELLSRIEKRFGVVLPERAYAEVQTPRDLLRTLERSSATAVRAFSTETAAARTGEAAPAPPSTETLVEVLEWHAQTHPDRVHIRFYSDEDGGPTLSYRELWEGARRIAAGLQSLGLQREEPVVLMLQTDRDYFFCFFGILLAGGIPVPIYPPARPAQIEDHIRRQHGILANCLASILITIPEAKPVARLLKAQTETLRHVVTASELTAAGGAPEQPVIGAKDTAFLQYTSGSTGNPKGVVLTHANLLANIRTMGTEIQANPADVFVSWLPLYHDMGLIGAWLGSLYYAASFVVMSPLAFIARPQRWLRAIQRHRGTLSAAPNFGYELCLNRLDDQDLAGLDLGSWRIAFNGAEPVSPETLRRFQERFQRYGLKPGVLMPVYGLAECSVGLSFPPVGRGPRVDRVQRAPFTGEHRAVPAAADDATALSFVGAGRAIRGHEIRIVDEDDRELPERQEGRLQFRGPSATSGYYRNPEATRRLFHNDWLESGDLAYFGDGELYLTGRIKDVIIRAGRNVYPHELEEAVGHVDGIRAGRVAVFGSRDPALATERLVVVAETRVEEPAARARLEAAVRATIADLSGEAPDDIVLAPPGAILKTPSGKIRRTACRDLYERGLIGKPRRAVWWQVARLSAAGVLPWLRRIRRRSAALLYGAYAHVLFWTIGLGVWLLVLALPSPRLRWRLLPAAAGLTARLAGIDVTVAGRERLPPPDRPCIYIANHASYLDAIVLVLAVRRPVSFVAKAELGRNPVIGPFLRRVGTAFVERFDIERGVEDLRSLAASARAGRTLFFFPEGTFTRAPGLRSFHMGAFLAAVEAGVPVVPIAIRGTRSVLRSESWWPARGSVTVTIEAPLAPGTAPDPWPAAVALRDAARSAILHHIGEPSVDQD